MVTRDDLEQLVKNRGQEAVGAAVVKIPDEDVRPALMLMVMIYQKSDEINREIFRRDQKRIAELEEELEKARAELHRLEQEKKNSFVIMSRLQFKAAACFLFSASWRLGKKSFAQARFYRIGGRFFVAYISRF